ncbi:hypothetical protein CDAR_589181 [Caerostris darwini]|uniref:Uncharacterized protein n=1 Tax=Caerostris darwini TaxID=1538125 RepID=A0AAV4TB64_9ARAC|nr:hypothetical protein CDAR_589181 [Caerostris darwini]
MGAGEGTGSTPFNNSICSVTIVLRPEEKTNPPLTRLDYSKRGSQTELRHSWHNADLLVEDSTTLLAVDDVSQDYEQSGEKTTRLDYSNGDANWHSWHNADFLVEDSTTLLAVGDVSQD